MRSSRLPHLHINTLFVTRKKKIKTSEVTKGIEKEKKKQRKKQSRDAVKHKTKERNMCSQKSGSASSREMYFVRTSQKKRGERKTNTKKKKNHVYNVKSKAQKKGYLQSSQSAAETTRNKIVKDLKTIKTVF